MSSVKITGLTRALTKLDRVNNLSKVVNTATKRTQRAAKTIASSSIREELALTKRYVDEKISVNGRFMTQSNREASITITTPSRGILMRNFRHRQNKRGTRITIKPGNPQTIKRMWMLKLKQGGETPVYWKQKPQVRRGKTGYWGGLALYAPSPSQVLNTKRDYISEEVAERWGRELKSAINYHTRVK